MNERLNQQLCESLKIALQDEDVLQNTEVSSKINSDQKKKPTPEQAAEALALIIDQLPEPKKYLSKGKYEINLDYYEEALKKYTQPDIKKNIHKFQETYQLNIEKINCENYNDSQFIRTKFINWATMILKCDYQDIYYKYNPKPPKPNQKSKPPTIVISTDVQIGENFTIGDTLPCPSLYGLQLILEKELKQIARQLKYQIEEDPENRFRNCHVENKPNCNCQNLIKLRYLKEPPLTLKQIHKKLGIPLTTISSHLSRRCNCLLREIAEELGYE